MRRPFLMLAFLLVISVMVGACGLSERGSGNVETESRDVSGFEEIVLKGSGTVNVSVTGTESLVVEADDNLLPLLDSEVRNGRLELGPNQSISPTQDVVYTITAVTLEGVTISGSGFVTATGIDASGFAVDISGSGTVVAEGISNSLDLSISGSGEYEGEELVSATGSVSVSGSGDALVNVTDDLDVGVSGSGNVQFMGDPTVSVATSGSGNVSQR